MGLIHGITVQLLVATRAGVDSFNAPVVSETWVDVQNVLVTPSSAQETADSMHLYGKRSVYTLSIPKGDNHNWQDTKVKIRGSEFWTIGPEYEYIEGLVPLDWNKKIQVANNGWS